MDLRKLYNIGIYYLANKTFNIWQRLGFHITPNHFYYPIPDTRDLNDKLWLNKSELVNIQLNDEKQLKLLESFASRFKNEYDNFPIDKTDINHEYYLNNKSFETIDAEILYI